MPAWGDAAGWMSRSGEVSDTRYQLATEPVDERWIGRKPKGHYAWHQGQTVTMKEARAKWGV